MSQHDDRLSSHLHSLLEDFRRIRFRAPPTKYEECVEALRSLRSNEPKVRLVLVAKKIDTAWKM